MLRILPFLLILALWIYTFVDCLNTPEKEVRGLPKIAWVLIILLFGEVLLGPVAWLLAARPRGGAGPRPYGRRGGGGRGWVAPDDNPEFLKSLKPDEKKDDGPRATRRPRADAGRRSEASLDRVRRAGPVDGRGAQRAPLQR
ncbi:PLD nuclease N-terminal domain-containing protein [Streptomyces stramineus]